MRKIIAAFNMSLDGNGDHTAGLPDADIHKHYEDLLNNSGVILYGSKTFELMKFWQTLVQKPSGDKTMDDFAVAIDRIPKIVFSRKLQDTGWASATLANQPLEETVRELKNQPGNDILVGSRSLIIQLLNLELIDEFQLCIHPVIAGKGLQLFENIAGRIHLRLIQTKSFGGGAVAVYYAPVKN